MNFQFEKYQGAGNDFIIIDDRKENFPDQDHSLIQKLCDRHFGIGADGLILVRIQIVQILKCSISMPMVIPVAFVVMAVGVCLPLPKNIK